MTELLKRALGVIGNLRRARLALTYEERDSALRCCAESNRLLTLRPGGGR